MIAQITYGKTDKGQDEIRRRSGELSLVERRLLIFVNGSRSLTQLRQLMRGEDVPGMIEGLLNKGFIAATSQGGAATPAQPAPVQPPPVQAAPPQPAPVQAPPPQAAPAAPPPQPAQQVPEAAQVPPQEAVEAPPPEVSAVPAKVTEAKEYMIDALRSYTNPIRSRRLAESIASSNSIVELNEHVGTWYEALCDSPQGIHHADDLNNGLQALLI